MDYLDKFFDKDYLMHTPVSFLLQNKKVEDLCSFYDDHGWTIMHYAVGYGEISKITEFLHFNLDFNKNSERNIIPEDIFIINDKKKSPEKYPILNKIPFVQKGFTPVHLAIYLFNHYSAINKLNGGSDFFHNNIVDKYQKILNLLLTKERISENKLDSNGKSYLDYAFLTENIAIIEMMHMLDPTFDTFRQVKPMTAKKILEVMEIKHKEGSHDYLIKQLDTKILETSLQQKLAKNHLYPQKINKI